MNPKSKMTIRLVNKMGPKKLKSCPLLAAQCVYAVRDNTTAAVNRRASNTINPVSTKSKWD